MNNTGIRALAQHLQSQGRGRDTILAHIMPEEAAMLKRMGGSGTINPRTGLLEFQNPGDIAGGGYGSGNVGGGSSPGYSSGGGQDSPSESGPGPGMGGGGSSWSGGGGRDSSSSNQSPNYGGGGGFDSSNWGVGGGMLSPGTPTMVSSGGGNFAPMGGNSSSNYLQSLGVPTIVANAMQNAGQSLLNFSDWSTGQYRQMMSGLTPTTEAQVTPGFRSEAALDAQAAQAAPQPNVDPLTGRDYDREATQRSIAWGEAIGGGIASLRDMLSAPQEVAPSTPGFRSEAASGVYDFTPDYTGTAREGEALRNQILSNQVNDMWGITPERQGDFGPAPEGFDVSPENVTNQIMTQAGVAIQPTSSFDASSPGFRSEAALEAQAPSSTAPSLEGLPPGLLGTFDMQTAIQQYRQSLNNIKVPSGFGFNVTAGDYANNPEQEKFYQTDAQVAQSIMKNLPLSGLQVGPNGDIQTLDGGIPSAEQMAKVAELAAREYTVPQSKLPEGAVGQMTLDPRQFVDVRSVPMPPERTTEVAQIVAQDLGNRLEASLADITQPSGLRSEVLSSAYDYTPSAPVTRGVTAPEQTAANLPTFAQSPVGSPMAFPETPTAMQYEGQYQPPAATGLPTFIEAAGITPDSTPGQINGILANMSTSQIYNILDEAERQRRTLESTTGPFKVRENPAVTRGVDPRLLDIARKESLSLPAGQYYAFTSGVRPGDKGVHSTGRALDVAIMTADGQRLPNYQNPVFFSNYEQPALVGREIQKQIYPELNNKYVWGGYFSGDSSIYGALDLMDRRILDPTNPDINKGGRRPAGGSWETGLTKQQAAIWGLPAGVTQVARNYGVTSPQTTQAAIQEGKLSNLLDYTYSGLRSEILTEGYNAPTQPLSGFRDVLKALGYTDEQLDQYEADLPSAEATPSADNLLDPTVQFPTGGGKDDSAYLKRLKELIDADKPEEEEPEPVVYTTGMDLTRKEYVPSANPETYSPAYP